MLQKADPRNEDIWVFIKDKLVHRNDAKISVFDSSVQGGDAVWEGIRLYPEGIFCLNLHLKRLQESAKAMYYDDIPTSAFIEDAIRQTLHANQMTQDCHIRLTLTRGEKITSGMDPRLNQYGSTLIVLAEWKPPVYDNASGITVLTSAIRRNSPMHVDSKIHHNNLINNILAKIQANIAGKDAALLLDESGFASELNGTNIFLVKDKVVYTPHADACLPGITRRLILDICTMQNIRCVEKNISLTELYTADEVFCTGTMGELTPVVEIDGRKIDLPSGTALFQVLRDHFEALRVNHCSPV